MTRGNSGPAGISTACPTLPYLYDELGEAESTHIRKKKMNRSSAGISPVGDGPARSDTARA